jgi:hypothetical protein
MFVPSTFCTRNISCWLAKRAEHNRVATATTEASILPLLLLLLLLLQVPP